MNVFVKTVFFITIAFILTGCFSQKNKSIELWKEGRLALSSDDRAGAMVLFQKAVNTDESNVNAHISIQELMKKENLHNECLRHYKDLFSKRQSAAWRRFVYARLLSSEQAKQLYEEGIKSQPSYAWFYYGLSNIEEQKGNIDQAVKLLEQSLILDPDLTDAYVRLGRLYALKKQFKIAENCFNLASEKDPFYADSYFYQGNLQLLYGNITNANELYQKALKISPDDDRIKYALGKIDFLNGRYAEAYNIFKELYEKDTRNSRLPVSCARAVFMTGDASLALNYLDKALSLQCDQGEVHFLKAMIFIETGANDKAEAEFYLAKNFLPDNENIKKTYALFKEFSAKGLSSGNQKTSRDVLDFNIYKNFLKI